MASSTQINNNIPPHHGIPTGFSWAEFLFPFCFEYQQQRQNQNISFHTAATSRITGNGITKFHQRRRTDCGLACVATVVSFFDNSSNFSNNKNNNNDEDLKSCCKNKREQRLIYDRIEAIFARNFSPSSSSSSLSPHQQAINLAVLSSTPMWTVEMFELFRILLFSDASLNSGAKFMKFYTSLKSVEEITNQWKKHCEKYPLFYQQHQQKDDTSSMMMISDSSRLSSMCRKLEEFAKPHQNAEENKIQLLVNTTLQTSTIVNQLVSSSSTSTSSSSVFVVLVNSLFLDCNCKKSEAVSQLALAELSIDENIVSKVATKLLSKAPALSLTKVLVPFVGHFVVVVGISKCRNYFLVWDPASHSAGTEKNEDENDDDDYSFCVVSYDSLDKARKIHEDGTDMEVIEIGC